MYLAKEPRNEQSCTCGSKPLIEEKNIFSKAVANFAGQ